MPLSNNNSKNYSLVGFSKNDQIDGLDSFARNLEKHFFSKVLVRNISKIPGQINLVIELTCNFKLNEALTHLKKEIWGNFSSKKHSFAGELRQLQNLNSLAIEVEELSIFLKDTSIIINSIYNQSIPEQLKNIFNELENSFVTIVKSTNEVPYEIYVPVYEQNDFSYEKIKDKNFEPSNNPAQEYFAYWGLYFYSEEDAMVYDLRNKTLIDGTLHMLNR